MEKPELDYIKLLDDWAEGLFKEAEEFKKKQDQAETGSYQHGYYKGKHDAIIMAITKLNILETRKNKTYIVTKDSEVEPTLCFQNRKWLKKELEIALDERSSQSQQITFLVKDKEALERDNKRLEKENDRFQIMIDDVASSIGCSF